MDCEKRKNFIIDFAFVAIVLAMFYILLKYGINFLMPFIIALLVAILLKPAVKFLNEKLKINRKISAVILVILFYGIIGTGIVLLVIQLGVFLKDIILKAPEIVNREIIPAFTLFFESINDWIYKLGPDLEEPVQNAYNNLVAGLGNFMTTFSKNALSALTSYATKVPQMLLNILITVIATLFITADFEILQKMLVYQFSSKNSVLYDNVKIHLSSTISKYIKSYAIIFTLSYVELALGLWIIGIKNAFLLALLIALFDLLPILGTGMILIPWSVISFVQGDFKQGIGIAILFTVIIIVRNMVEPKIIGDKVGMHPLVALLAMIIGLKLFGLIGLIGVPVTLALLISLNEANAINIFKNNPDNEIKEDKDKPKKPFRPFKRKGPIDPVIKCDNSQDEDA